MACVVCATTATRAFCEAYRRVYRECATCRVVYMAPEYRVSPDAEKRRYDTHQNSLENEGYVKFLSKLLVPLQSRLPDSAKGLDYGSGPTPVLAELLRRNGHTVDVYDPFYAPDTAPLQQLGAYDFITCTEVAEHFFTPLDEFKRMMSLLKPQGVLGVMTSFYYDTIDFGKWHYARDDTHVVFYRKESIQWLAEQLDATAEIVDPVNVAIFRKNS